MGSAAYRVGRLCILRMMYLPTSSNLYKIPIQTRDQSGKYVKYNIIGNNGEKIESLRAKWWVEWGVFLEDYYYYIIIN